jgi:hypothetical protein
MVTHQKSKDFINEAIIRDIKTAIEKMKYGTVIITVHNNKITQMEVSEKKRFDNVWIIEEGGGI